MSESPVLIGVMGPTASGKTGLAEALAERLDAVLINADAFQAYRGMDIGTAKPERRERYRLLDIKEPDEPYGVGEFCVRAAAELADLHREGRHAVVVGGTGQYVRALFEEFKDLSPAPDPALREEIVGRLGTQGLPALVEELRALGKAEGIDLSNPVRVTRALERAYDRMPRLEFRVEYTKRIKFSTTLDAQTNVERITNRVDAMMHNGWVNEVRRLRMQGYEPGMPGFRAIGYKAISSLVDGDLEPEEAKRAIVSETVAYAKRQRTWLRSEPGLLDSVPGTPDGLERVWSAVRDLISKG